MVRKDDTSEETPTRSRGRKQATCGQRFMKCLSVADNVDLLFEKRAPAEHKELEALNGIRVITLTVIILGNTYFYMLKGPL